jgi:hypothetical protein
MFSLLSFRWDGDLLRFTIAPSGFDDDEWYHTAAADQVVPWIDDVLLPLALERGDDLSAAEVIDRVTGKAQDKAARLAGIDWLGLTLFASQRVREAAAALAGGDSPQIQAQLAAAFNLEKTLSCIYRQVGQAIAAALHAA